MSRPAPRHRPGGVGQLARRPRSSMGPALVDGHGRRGRTADSGSCGHRARTARPRSAVCVRAASARWRVVDLVDADLAALAEQLPDVRGGGDGRPRAGVVAADSSAVARCSRASRRRGRPLVGQQHGVVQRQRGAGGDLLDAAPRSSSLKRRARPGSRPSPRTASTRPRTVSGTASAGAARRPAAPRAGVRRAAAGPVSGRPSAVSRARPVATTAGRAGRRPGSTPSEGASVAASGRRDRRPGAAGRRRRPDGRRKVGEPAVDHQPGQRGQLLVDAGLAVERGADVGEQALPLGLPVAGVDVGAAADVAGELVVPRRGARPARAASGRRRRRGAAGTRPPRPVPRRGGGDRLGVAVPVLGVQPVLPAAPEIVGDRARR